MEAAGTWVYHARVWTTDLSNKPGREWVVQSVTLEDAIGAALPIRTNTLAKQQYYYRDQTPVAAGEASRLFGAHADQALDMSTVNSIVCQVKAVDRDNRINQFTNIPLPPDNIADNTPRTADSGAAASVTIVSVSHYTVVSPPLTPDSMNHAHTDIGIQVTFRLKSQAADEHNLNLIDARDAAGGNLRLAIAGNQIWPVNNYYCNNDSMLYACYLRLPRRGSSTFSLSVAYRASYSGPVKTLIFPAVVTPYVGPPSTTPPPGPAGAQPAR